MNTLEPFEDLRVAAAVAIDDHGEPRLNTSTCNDCGRAMVGTREICSGCMGSSLAATQAGPEGAVYSYTTVHVSPVFEKPQLMGYVDLDDVRVLALLKGKASCDARGRLVLDETDWYFQVGEGETS